MERFCAVLIASLALFSLGRLCPAQEEGGEKKPEQKRREAGARVEVEHDGGERRVRIEVRGDGERRIVPFGMGRHRSRRTVIRPSRVNVVDGAYFEIAELLVNKQEYDEAIEELKRITAASPDPEAAGAAHLSMGHILRQKMGDTEGAIAEYRQVTGRYAETARREIVRAYEEVGEIGKAVAVLDEMLAKAEAPGDKAKILSDIAEVYKKSNDLDRAIETLRKIPTVITYEEAMKADPRFRVHVREGGMEGIRVRDGDRERPIRGKAKE